MRTGVFWPSCICVWNLPLTCTQLSGVNFAASLDCTVTPMALASATQQATVKLLIERGAPVNVLDGEGRTPLALAVRACVDSYWVYRCSPESVQMLLNAGASVNGVEFPSGYAEVDELLRQRGARNIEEGTHGD